MTVAGDTTGAPDISYQWESSITASNAGFTEISGVVSASYDPPPGVVTQTTWYRSCLLYTSPSPRDGLLSRMPSSA